MDADCQIEQVLAHAAELAWLAKLHAELAVTLKIESDRLLREAEERLLASAAVFVYRSHQ